MSMKLTRANIFYLMKVHFISLILAIHVLEVFFSLIGVKGIRHKNIEAKVDNLEVRKNYLTPILK
jgi:hypothetical protein